MARLERGCRRANVAEAACDPEPSGRLTEDARAATRGGVGSLVLQTAGRIVALVFVAVVTRRLSPDAFGRYSTVSAIVLLANQLGDCGTTPAITRLVSRDPDRSDPLLSGTLLTSLLLGVLGYLAAVGFALVAAYPPDLVADVAIGALAIPAQAVLWSLLGALDGRGWILGRARLSLLQTGVVASGALWVVLGSGVRGAIVALAAAPYVTLLFAVLHARRASVWRPALRLDLAASKMLFGVAAPFAVMGLLQALTMRFDVVLLSLTHSSADTATYDVALRLIEACGYVAIAVGTPALFLLSGRIGRGDVEGAARAYAVATRMLYVIGLPLSLGIAAFARPIAVLALGQQFDAVARPLAVMGSGVWLMFLVAIQVVLIQAGDHIRRGVEVAVFNVAVTVVLDLALIPPHGVTGATVAMLLSWAVSAAAFHALHRRTLNIATPLPPLGAVVGTATVGLVALALQTAPVAAVLLGGGVYVAIILLTRTVTALDIARLRAAFVSTPP